MLYKLLWVNKDSTQAEIRQNYKALSRVVHPDKSNLQEMEKSLQIFRNLEEAFKVLSCPVQRHLYDHYGDHGLEIYSGHQNYFKECLDSPKDTELIDQKYLSVLRKEETNKILEKFNKQKVTIGIHSLVASSMKNEMSVNPYSVFMFSSFNYQASLKLSQYNELAYDLEGKSLNINYGRTATIYGHEIDVKSTLPLWSPLSPSLQLLKKFGKFGLQGKVQFNTLVPTLSLNGFYSIDYFYSMISLVGSSYGYGASAYTSKIFNLNDELQYKINCNLGLATASLEHKLTYKMNHKISLVGKMVRNILGKNLEAKGPAYGAKPPCD